jgi:hypothetical protein
MGEKSNRRKGTARKIWSLVFAIIGIIAIVQELQKPKDQRTWHGKVADLVPYDFRMPTVERIKATYWNPEGPVLPGKVFGAGWALNVGAIVARFTKSGDR